MPATAKPSPHRASRTSPGGVCNPAATGAWSGGPPAPRTGVGAATVARRAPIATTRPTRRRRNLRPSPAISTPCGLPCTPCRREEASARARRHLNTVRCARTGANGRRRRRPAGQPPRPHARVGQPRRAPLPDPDEVLCDQQRQGSRRPRSRHPNLPRHVACQGRRPGAARCGGRRIRTLECGPPTRKPPQHHATPANTIYRYCMLDPTLSIMIIRYFYFVSI